jgi:hypothetical protein
MKRLSPAILSIFILLYSGEVFSQDAGMIKRQVIGTWVNADDNADKYVFLANGDCRYYFSDSKKRYNYTYSITNDPISCESGIKKRVGDTTAYIRLYDIREKSTSCYVIDEISAQSLTLRWFGQGGHLFYIKKVDKRH